MRNFSNLQECPPLEDNLFAQVPVEELGAPALALSQQTREALMTKFDYQKYLRERSNPKAQKPGAGRRR